jgi:hypothetical protein
LEGNTPNLIGYWEMNEGEGQEVLDKTETSAHGQIGSSSSQDGNDAQWIEEGCNFSASLDVVDFEDLGLKIYPNPVISQLHVSLNAVNDYTITLTDILGRRVYTKTYSNTEISQSIIVPVDRLKEGNYILTLVMGNNTHNQMIIVRK